VLADAADYRSAVGWLADAGPLDAALAIASDHALVCTAWDWWEPHDWLRRLLADPASADCAHRSAALGALAVTTMWHEADLAETERLALAAIACRADPSQAPSVHNAEFAMSFLTLVRGEFDASVAWAQRFIDDARADDDPSVPAGMFLASAGLAQAGRVDEAQVVLAELQRYLERRPWGGADYVLNHALGYIHMESDPDRARHHFELASQAGRDAGSPFWARNSTVEVMSLFIAHGPVTEAAVAAREVIEAMWDGRDLGNMARAVAHCVVICARAGHYDDAARIDGWLGQRGRSLVPGDLIRYQHARTDIDAHLGGQAARLRAQAATWSTPTAVEHILTSLRAVSDSPPASDADRPHAGHQAR